MVVVVVVAVAVAIVAKKNNFSNEFNLKRKNFALAGPHTGLHANILWRQKCLVGIE